jgi:hypothetical protein
MRLLSAVITFVILSGGLGASAEEPLELGFSIGYTAFATMGDLEADDYRYAARAPAYAVHFDVPVARATSIVVQPMVLRKGMGSDYSRTGRVDVTITALEVPMLLRMRVKPGGGLYADLGMTMGIPLSQRTTAPPHFPPPPKAGTSFGAVLGAGWQWRVRSRHVVLLGFQYLHDVTRTFEPRENYYPFREGAGSRVLVLSAGFGFTSGR